jgi:hypothetical protein
VTDFPYEISTVAPVLEAPCVRETVRWGAPGHAPYSLVPADRVVPGPGST